MRRLKQYKGGMLALALALAAVATLMFMLKQCSSDAGAPFYREYVKSGGDTLDVAIEMTPGIYSLKGDSASGRDYDLLRKMSADLGLPIKFHPFVPLRHALDGLKAGRYDIAAASLPATSRLRDSFLLTEPVYLDREVLVQKAGEEGPEIKSQLQLAGDTVWLASDSPFAERIANLSQEIGDTIYVRQSEKYNAEHLVILVAAGKIRLAVVNEDIAKSMLDDYPGIDISTPVSFTQFQSWALNRENAPLADKINAWLAESERTF